MPKKIKTSNHEPGWLLYLLLLTLSLSTNASLLTGCKTTRAGDDAGGADEVVGRPPPVDDDPFANRTLPADARPAEARGTIGEATARSAKPNPEPDPLTKPPAGEHRCFSCVRICPDSDPTPDCSQTPENIICGWGTSDRERDAMKLATAECDATLDLARGMPRYSRIDGQCPQATCR